MAGEYSRLVYFKATVVGTPHPGMDVEKCSELIVNAEPPKCVQRVAVSS